MQQDDRGFVVLLASLIVVLFVHPFLELDGHPSMITEGVLGVVPLAGSLVLRPSRRHFRISMTLWIPFAILWGLRHGTGNQAVRPAELIAALVFFAFVTTCLLRCLFRVERVRGGVLAGAAGIYLLIGFAWTHGYELVEVLFPGSFGDVTPTWNTFLYFSFMTLTTVGYGDMTPTSGPARALAVLEAVAGVLYIGFVIARFASRYGEMDASPPPIDVE